MSETLYLTPLVPDFQFGADDSSPDAPANAGGAAAAASASGANVAMVAGLPQEGSDDVATSKKGHASKPSFGPDAAGPAGYPAPPTSGAPGDTQCPYNTSVPPDAFGLGATDMGYVDKLFLILQFARQNPSSISAQGTVLQYVVNLLNYLSTAPGANDPQSQNGMGLQTVENMLLGLNDGNQQSAGTFLTPYLIQTILQQAEMVFLQNGANSNAVTAATVWLNQLSNSLGGSSNPIIQAIEGDIKSAISDVYSSNGPNGQPSGSLVGYTNQFMATGTGGIVFNGQTYLLSNPNQAYIIYEQIAGGFGATNPLTDGAARGITPAYFSGGIDFFCSIYQDPMLAISLFMGGGALNFYNGILNMFANQTNTLNSFSNEQVANEIQLMNEIQQQIEAYQQSAFAGLDSPAQGSTTSGNTTENQQYIADMAIFAGDVSNDSALQTEIGNFFQNLGAMSATMNFNPTLSPLASSWMSQVFEPLMGSKGSVYYTVTASGDAPSPVSPPSGSSTYPTTTVEAYLLQCEQPGGNMTNFAIFFATLDMNAPISGSSYISGPQGGPSQVAQTNTSAMQAMATTVNNRSQTLNTEVQYYSSLYQASSGFLNFATNPTQTGGLESASFSIMNNDIQH